MEEDKRDEGKSVCRKFGQSRAIASAEGERICPHPALSQGERERKGFRHCPRRSYERGASPLGGDLREMTPA
ncbi:MAG: hypothetical protein V3V62_08245, partial [bacterium]